MLMSPILETERLILRRFDLADAPAVQALVSDRRIALTTLNIPHPYPEGGALEWINRSHEHAAQGDALELALTLKADHHVIGCVSFRLQTQRRWAEMGYWIGTPYWGHGYMTEAVRRFIEFGFDDLNLNRICASYLTTNPASGRVMEKADMSYEGTLLQHVKRWGEFHDLGLYGILRSEYESRKVN